MPTMTQHQFVDLHAHSTASDGSRRPAQVAAAACGAGLSAIALTDHDTVAGLDEAAAAAAEHGLRFVPGVELSAVEDDAETHILGLHVTERSQLERRLVALQEMRRTRAARMVERLNALGMPVTMDAVLRLAAGGAVGRPHVARALIAGGWVGDFREAFERFLGNNRAAFIPKDRLPVAEAIDIIHQAGGIAVLAHPGSQLTRERLASFAAAGLDGVEVLHPSHSYDDSQRIDAFAGELNLVRSGGSDWHGADDGARTLGTMRVPALWLSEQDARVAALASRRVA